MRFVSGEHPIIAYYGETDAARYPLILVIGREPNANQVIANTVGQYDFRLAPLCGFWNTSYGMLARVVGLDVRGLKKLCVERRGSPLIYADSLPHCLPNTTANKRAYRDRVATEKVVTHIASIFSHRELVDRVGLVIMSGLRSSLFRPARLAIERECEFLTTPVIDLPFFFGTNTKKIQRELTEENRRLLSSIFERFEVA